MNNVLVVDDNKIDRLLSAMAVQRYDPDIRTTEAKDGIEALELIKSAGSQPDMILLDINMPRMSGKEFLEAFSQLQEHNISITMVTSSADEGDMSFCLAFPFVVDYLVKPIDPKDLEKIKIS